MSRMLGLLVVAVGALVAQNLLMANVVRSASSVVAVIATNSAVGLLALVTLFRLAGIVAAVVRSDP